jgi:hypothetical protein
MKRAAPLQVRTAAGPAGSGWTDPGRSCRNDPGRAGTVGPGRPSRAGPSTPRCFELERLGRGGDSDAATVYTAASSRRVRRPCRVARPGRVERIRDPSRPSQLESESIPRDPSRSLAIRVNPSRSESIPESLLAIRVDPLKLARRIASRSEGANRASGPGGSGEQPSRADISDGSARADLARIRFDPKPGSEPIRSEGQTDPPFAAIKSPLGGPIRSALSEALLRNGSVRIRASARTATISLRCRWRSLRCTWRWGSTQENGSVVVFLHVRLASVSCALMNRYVHSVVRVVGAVWRTVCASATALAFFCASRKTIASDTCAARRNRMYNQELSSI